LRGSLMGSWSAPWLTVTPNSNPSAGSGSGIEEGEGEGGGDGDGGASIQCLWPPARLLSPCRPCPPLRPRVGGSDELWASPPRLPPWLPRRLPPRPRPDGRPSRPPLDPIPLTMVPAAVWRRTVGKKATSVCDELAGHGL
jgi:hypothetical protein